MSGGGIGPRSNSRTGADLTGLPVMIDAVCTLRGGLSLPTDNKTTVNGFRPGPGAWRQLSMTGHRRRVIVPNF